MRPRIGITTSFKDGKQIIKHAYVQAVERAGGLPVIVPMVSSREMADEIASMLDGLVITGGPAIMDGLVGKLPNDINRTDPLRSESDTSILREFLRSDKPVLGICYGMQLINAAFGGTIYADVQRQVKDAIAHSDKRGATMHPAEFQTGTWVARAMGTGPVDVNTPHIQAVADLGPSLIVSGVAPDGVIEALETEDGRVLGVQFHPERMGEAGRGLFNHLISRAQGVTRDP